MLIAEKRSPMTHEAMMALPLRTCKQCNRLDDGRCPVYSMRKMPLPAKPSRCRHFEAAEGVCRGCGNAFKSVRAGHVYCSDDCRRAL